MGSIVIVVHTMHRLTLLGRRLFCFIVHVRQTRCSFFTIYARLNVWPMDSCITKKSSHFYFKYVNDTQLLRVRFELKLHVLCFEMCVGCKVKRFLFFQNKYYKILEKMFGNEIEPIQLRRKQHCKNCINEVLHTTYLC